MNKSRKICCSREHNHQYSLIRHGYLHAHVYINAFLSAQFMKIFLKDNQSIFGAQENSTSIT